jgi:TRAP-type C4-dicarboxylate transport system permease small subunit
MQENEARRPSAVERFIDTTEKAAGIFLAAVTALVFINVMLRGTTSGASRFLNWITGSEAYRFVLTIPEWFHLSCLALGVCILWGLAATSYRNDHIKVDILWDWSSPASRRWIDLTATGILLLFLVVFSWMLGVKVMSGYYSGEATYDLRLKLWPFHAVMALGVYCATILVGIRWYRLARGTHVERAHPTLPVE